VPEPAGQCARSAVRREAVDVLRLAASTAGYAAEQIGNGLGPEQARRAAAEAAAELEATAAALRRLARRAAQPGAAERRELAVRLSASGLTPQEIAGRIGVRRQTVSGYLARRRPAGR
jgi:DNA-binding NarL/FixJ family response regulator